ncbi:hypothetical protein DY000_02040300 [Brassica cretica]|uniref:Uncharacterized protein n=1 Tax=Brassica cretica TaxID=69181 RepID=A0ABQ7B5T1_BRACR|nr:hypothetical protein DY000_02040300 [Brassica cretica]
MCSATHARRRFLYTSRLRLNRSTIAGRNLHTIRHTAARVSTSLEVNASQEAENVETATEKKELELSASCGWLTATKTFKSSSLLEKFKKSLGSDSHGNGSASSETDRVIISPSRFQPLLDDGDSVDAEDTVDNLEEGEIRSMAKTKDKKGGSQAKRSKKGYQLDSSLRKALRRKRESSDKSLKRVATQRPNACSARSLRSNRVATELKPKFGRYRHLFKWADECLVEEVEDIKSLISGMNKNISEFRLSVAQLEKEIEVMKTASEGKGEECMSQGRCLRNVFVCGVGMSLLCYYYYFV